MAFASCMAHHDAILRSMAKAKNLFLGFTIWLGMVLICALLARTSIWHEYYHLAQNGVSTQGKIIAKEPRNHQRLHYSFTVNGQDFTGTGHGLQGGIPSFEAIQVGDRVLVFYDASNPHVSRLGDPKKEVASAKRSILFVSLIFPTLILLAFLRGWSRWKKRSRSG